MARQHEKDLVDKIVNRPPSDVVTDLRSLLEYRLERYKNNLISSSDDLTRGRAMECRDLLEKILPSMS